jgi:hypothetical protein
MEYEPNHWQNAARGRAREVASRNRTTTRPPAALAMRAMAVEFPQVHGHPNRLPFEGVLTLVDVASDKAPSGARGHRVILSRAAAEAALPSLLGMAVDYKSGWDGHDARQKCGIITSAEALGITLSEAIAADAILPPVALAAPAQVLANLTSLTVTSASGTAVQIDAGVDPPAGGGFEVRHRDFGFGTGVGRGLVLRSPVRSFSIPRSAQVETFYVRMFDALNAPPYSRHSSAVFVNLPIA